MIAFCVQTRRKYPQPVALIFKTDIDPAALRVLHIGPFFIGRRILCPNRIQSGKDRES